MRNKRSTMAQQNVNVQLLLVIIAIQDGLNFPIVTSTGTKIPIEEDDIGKIVNVHNDFRARESPSGNMQLIQWNTDLAEVAENYAQMCMFDPNPNKAAQVPFSTIEENRAFGRTTNYTDLIKRGWFVQRLNYNASTNTCLSPGACDEYILITNSEINTIGCGAAQCPTVTGLPILTNAVVLVCNYAIDTTVTPAGPDVSLQISNAPPVSSATLSVTLFTSIMLTLRR